MEDQFAGFGLLLLLIVVAAAFKVLTGGKLSKQRKADQKEAPHKGFGEFEIKQEAGSGNSGTGYEPIYKSQTRLLTPFETAAFRQLVKALGGAAHVAPKVRIADILEVDSSGDWKADKSAFLRISQKHVDFVIISYSGDILFAVEIDDSTHQRPDRQKRDVFVDAAFRSAGVDLFRAAPGKLSENEELVARVRGMRQPPAEDLAEAS